MSRNACCFCLVILTVAGLAGCSGEPAAKEAQKPAIPLDKIQGKAQIVLSETNATDAALDAGGPSVYLVEGLKRYRLFFRTAIPVDGGKEYQAEGIWAQKVIDAIGDPDQGKNGYPLESSCQRVVEAAWPGLSFDVRDGQVAVLRRRVQRYPARPVFLVTGLTPVEAPADAAAKDKEDAGEKNVPEISVPAEKQQALLVESPGVQTAPLWAPAGGTEQCKVVIGTDGKIAALATGIQLCEATPWAQYRYKPHLQGGHAVKVETDVEVRFEPRK